MIQKDWFASWFNTTFYHDLYSKRNDDEAKGFMEYLSFRLKWNHNVTILDACCGAGRHALYLESKGFQVYGMDLSENNILTAQSLSRHPERWFISDVRSFRLPNQVDFALNLFTSFGYFENDDDHLRMLKTMNVNLKNNGIFVLDFLNLSFVQSNMKELEIIKGKLADYEINRGILQGKIVKRISFVSDDKSYCFEEKVMAYDQDQLRKLLERAGFDILNVWGDYQGNPVDEYSPRCIFVSKKTRDV